MTEDEMVGWHHQLDRHEFQQASGTGGQGSLASCIHGVAKCQTRLSNSTELRDKHVSIHIQGTQICQDPCLEKAQFSRRDKRKKKTANVLNDKCITNVNTWYRSTIKKMLINQPMANQRFYRSNTFKKFSRMSLSGRQFFSKCVLHSNFFEK